MSSKTTDVIIVFYGDPEELKTCIRSVESHCENYVLHVIDNNSENRGFTKGVNEGIAGGNAPYIWLLNQDAVLLPGAQDALIERLQSCPQVGIAGSMQISPGDMDFVTHGGTSRAFPGGVHKGGRLSRKECLIPEKQTWVNFASVMLKREMVSQIGMLDDRMFLFYSDSDYCYWARFNGWEVWYEPNSRVLHKLKASQKLSEWHIKDRNAFAGKWGIKLTSETAFTCPRIFYDLNAGPITFPPQQRMTGSPPPIQKNPKSPESLNAIASGLVEQKKFDEAFAAYQKALQTYPTHAPTHYYMGNVLKKIGKIDAALNHYFMAVKLQPTLAEAFFNMGNTFKSLGKCNEAVSCYEKAIEVKPEYVEAHCNLGLVLQGKGELEKAIRTWRRTVRTFPTLFEGWFNLGNALKQQGECSEAIRCFQKTLALRPDYAWAYNNLGNIFRERKEFKKAFACYKKALQTDPRNAAVHNNMGNTFQDLGKIDSALKSFDQALKLRPEHAETHFNRALALLLSGNLQEGFKAYEWRFKKSDWKTVYPETYSIPRWDGSSFHGKRLLVHHEQGHGDNIQFIRYLPLVKARGGTVVFKASKPLLRLFQDFPGLDELIEGPNEKKFPNMFDYQVPLLSLPRIFETTIASIPQPEPYLHADMRDVETWKALLGNDGFKIGLVWAGNRKHKNDHNRSCPLENFLPLSHIPGIRLYGLQKETVQSDNSLTQKMLIGNFGKKLSDFADTAGALENMDLLISVDTSVAHLAGAMGKPVWLLLPFAPDWRWMLSREDSPWYPTMRLFRQNRPGNWKSVIDRIATALLEYVSKSGQCNKLEKRDDRFF